MSDLLEMSLMAALYVHEAGDSGAPPIVFLHGGGLSGRMWQPQLATLTDFHCLAPDLPEHGRVALCRSRCPVQRQQLQP